jgi:site-specific DNA-cytosine methylase
MRPLDDFIIDKTIYDNINPCINIQKKLKQINCAKNYIFPNSNYVNPSFNVCPTLTTRCDMFYHTTYNRYLIANECFILQGFSNNFNKVVSKHQLCKQIGNSMSVNVLKNILQQILTSTTLQQFV